MVVIPAGEFVMGAGSGEVEPGYLVDEARSLASPQRRVKVSGFSAGKYEVTRGQYRAFVAATGRSGDGCFGWSGGEYRFDPAKGWHDPGYAQDDAHPVACVSWEDADAYVRWLSARTGRRYRLLTEAEWEYAARAGTTTARYWGGKSESDDAVASCGHANGADSTLLPLFAEAAGWAAAECRDGFAYTAPAGRFRPNAFGLHDMLGNVAEWTADCRNDTYRGAPADGRAWTAGNCYMRMVRGGGWDDGMTALRSAYRIASPVVVRVYTRGFRVARQE